MEKRYLKHIFIFVVGFLLLIPNKVSAVKEYTIEKYNIDMVVNEDNTFNITETITADFNISKHGIYRKIPLKNSLTRTDGTVTSNRTKITNITVSENYTEYVENGYKVIKIGNANSKIIGEHTYTIKYTYDIGKDPLKNVDELYFNLIGNEWDTSIDNITFKVIMPKEFDTSSLGFSGGNVGSQDNSNVYYKVDGNIIYGALYNRLNEKEGLTIRITLPEEYFVGENLIVDIPSVLIIILCLVSLVFVTRLWFKYGKDDEIVETVEFYPPKGYNSAEVGFLYKGFSDKKGIISLLIYLANKGYLKIEEAEDSIKIVKLKEYKGNNEYEKIFFDGLFEFNKENNEKTDKDNVTLEELKNKFYKTLEKIEIKFNSKENKSKIFDWQSKGKRKKIIFLSIAILFLITLRPIWGTGVSLVDFFEKTTDMAISLIVSGICLAGVYVILFSKQIAFKIVGMIHGVLFGMIGIIGIVFPNIMKDNIYIVTYIIGILSIGILTFFAKVIDKRTYYGNSILGKIKGFKRFLETAEKSQLEILVNKNSEYFYTILPYTYALGVSDIWMNQFETIAFKKPNWYRSMEKNDSKSFKSFINNTMPDAINAMSSIPSSGSSGGSSRGSSGGGSSGGGSGGGGGGSW